MSKESSSTLNRRRVFAGAGTVGALAAAAAVLPAVSGEQAVADAAPAKPDADGRYQVTQHVQRYYQTAKV